ncbi:endo-1,3-beta-glucanase [Virgisporangium aliadipatigenens]|uniref:Endo-1,3-beta-glucanase n=1 Tax=Virgisporangium aliadipatigenens TaxID=741659 RepID=A0A8J3YPN5_9ACTN|nr:glycoside hydrolase family 16 protein [Virgisporangium aliadipatigenens]GIJ49474.1 endo-1,3-beta-glucanase [Virgisporangium aliadipatigenens]
MPTQPPTGARTGRRRLIRRVTAGAAGAVALVASVAVVINANASVPPTPSGWTSVWTDDFVGSANTLPDSANWIIDTGHNYPGGPANWGTGEIQNYTNSTQNVAKDGNGNLRITALRDGSGNWTSARIETQRTNFRPPAGGVMAMEGRIQMPNITGAPALGYWPAFWALGSPYRGNYQNWPSIGEFDIMENVNGINNVHGVLHCGVAPGGPCNEFNGIGANRACPGASCQSAFHTYRFEWDESTSPKQLRWYVDGQQFHTVTQSQVGEPHWTNMTNHAGYFMLLNLAIGGGFPNGVCGCTSPDGGTQPGASMLVDYVTVQTRGGTPPPTTQPPTSPPPTGGGGNAYSRLQAESFNANNGVGTEATTDEGGGQNIGWLANGDWARYDNIDFGSTPATNFQARVASGAGAGISGLLEVRLDSPTATPIGSFAVGNTGGWQTWRTIPANISNVTGKHTVYLTFTSGQPADFLNVNWFTFVH